MGKFEELYALNVNSKTEKKGNLTYLSWAWAWAEFKKAYPDANYKINQFDGTFCTGNEKIGYMVHTQVTAGEQTYEMWLPVMESRNNTILQPKMTEVNKTIMRCLTKNISMFGLGLYIYAGEDLPENEESVEDKPKQAVGTQGSTQNRAKTQEQGKQFNPLTRAEMMQFYGVKNVEQTIEWFEDRFQVAFDEWGQEECEMARLKLAEKKRKSEAEERAKNAMYSDEDIPFPTGEQA